MDTWGRVTVPQMPKPSTRLLVKTHKRLACDGKLAIEKGK
jgi:hypothetical protein